MPVDGSGRDSEVGVEMRCAGLGLEAAAVSLE